MLAATQPTVGTFVTTVMLCAHRITTVADDASDAAEVSSTSSHHFAGDALKLRLVVGVPIHKHTQSARDAAAVGVH